MSSTPFISICIPAYGRADLLRQLFDSILKQRFTDYEVVVTDNSPDKSVENLCGEYAPRLSPVYHRNETFLEMGGNWNACMQRGKGQWLKMMHDDDWFEGPESLGRFAEVARAHQHGMICSGYFNAQLGSDQRQAVLLKAVDQFFLQGAPFNLLRGNHIGPPSVTLIHRSSFQPFKAGLRWMVDMDCYLRMLQLRHGFHYIPETLVCIGVHPGQATSKYFRNPAVEIPENCVMLYAQYPSFCRNVFAYDHCWRLMRNLGIRSAEQLDAFAGATPVPPVFYRIIVAQREIPASLLRIGILSKAMMLLHYLYVNLSGLPRVGS